MLGIILLLIALISTGVFAYTAYLGGQIIHHELESNIQSELLYDGYEEFSTLIKNDSLNQT